MKKEGTRRRRSLLVCASMLCVALAAGTFAYLQDSDSDVNVMTLGNVSIAQHEYERAVNADGSFVTYTETERSGNPTGYKLTEFTQAKPLLPATGEVTGWDDTKVYFAQLPDDSNMGFMSVLDGINNVQDKFVFVENTGKTDAYVRTIIAFEVGEKTDAFGDLIMINRNQFWAYNPFGVVNIDGNNYYIVEFVYDGVDSDTDVANGKHPGGVVPAGDFTYNNLAQVYMTSEATNEDVEAIDGNGNGTYDILVLSQAVQTAGFSDALTALDTGFGDVNAANVQEWFGSMNDVQYVEVDGEVQIEGEDAAAYLAMLKNGTDLIFDKDMDIIAFDADEVDACGATVTLQGVGSEAYGYLSFASDTGEDVTVSNLNVKGSGFVEIGEYGQNGGKYTVNNLVIDDLASTLANGNRGYTLACAFMGMGDTVLNNCIITGTTAVQDGAIPIDLGCGQAWTGYSDDDDDKISTTVNGGEYGTVWCWSHSITVINGAEIGTLYAAPIKGSVTIKSGTHIDTLDFSYGTVSGYANKANLSKLTVEDGATVDKVVFGDDTYTWAEWTDHLASLS